MADGGRLPGVGPSCGTSRARDGAVDHQPHAGVALTSTQRGTAGRRRRPRAAVRPRRRRAIPGRGREVRFGAVGPSRTERRPRRGSRGRSASGSRRRAGARACAGAARRPRQAHRHPAELSAPRRQRSPSRARGGPRGETREDDEGVRRPCRAHAIPRTLPSARARGSASTSTGSDRPRSSARRTASTVGADRAGRRALKPPSSRACADAAELVSAATASMTGGAIRIGWGSPARTASARTGTIASNRCGNELREPGRRTLRWGRRGNGGG